MTCLRFRAHNVPWCWLQEKVEALKAQAAAASQGGSVSSARLQERESYIASLQVWRPRHLLPCCVLPGQVMAPKTIAETLHVWHHGSVCQSWVVGSAMV